ncbi:hypothetical protein HXX76_008433 [Chlamydomonas incerta]|uniref:Uncharacterized protein n=1 Tax=Chlamydomonas incerta TaxID=51695 RepID=A0A835SU39_CHLIN|nr:hypothetical protein HXX76_008433 [Chlamydomonas incerta]|eukprot:KAG2433372.1 hypothetical protein HXX76_008433 [Chlamydomonas incerta]
MPDALPSASGDELAAELDVHMSALERILEAQLEACCRWRSAADRPEPAASAAAVSWRSTAADGRQRSQHPDPDLSQRHAAAAHQEADNAIQHSCGASTTGVRSAAGGAAGSTTAMASSMESSRRPPAPIRAGGSSDTAPSPGRITQQAAHSAEPAMTEDAGSSVHAQPPPPPPPQVLAPLGALPPGVPPLLQPHPCGPPLLQPPRPSYRLPPGYSLPCLGRLQSMGLVGSGSGAWQGLGLGGSEAAAAAAAAVADLHSQASLPIPPELPEPVPPAVAGEKAELPEPGGEEEARAPLAGPRAPSAVMTDASGGAAAAAAAAEATSQMTQRATWLPARSVFAAAFPATQEVGGGGGCGGSNRNGGGGGGLLGGLLASLSLGRRTLSLRRAGSNGVRASASAPSADDAAAGTARPPLLLLSPPQLQLQELLPAADSLPLLLPPEPLAQLLSPEDAALMCADMADLEACGLVGWDTAEDLEFAALERLSRAMVARRGGGDAASPSAAAQPPLQPLLCGGVLLPVAEAAQPAQAAAAAAETPGAQLAHPSPSAAASSAAAPAAHPPVVVVSARRSRHVSEPGGSSAGISGGGGGGGGVTSRRRGGAPRTPPRASLAGAVSPEPSCVHGGQPSSSYGPEGERGSSHCGSCYSPATAFGGSALSTPASTPAGVGSAHSCSSVIAPTYGSSNSRHGSSQASGAARHHHQQKQQRRASDVGGCGVGVCAEVPFSPCSVRSSPGGGYSSLRQRFEAAAAAAAAAGSVEEGGGGAAGETMAMAMGGGGAGGCGGIGRASLSSRCSFRAALGSKRPWR